MTNSDGNVFNLPQNIGASEVLETVCAGKGARIERIISTGQITPEDAPYVQAHDEWVLILQGKALLWLEGQGERSLGVGDMQFIPAHCAHRVTYTDAQPPTIWLAVHFSES